MRKEDAVAHFGSQDKVAAALGITRQAVQAWPDRVPWERAFQLEEITHGRLQAVPDHLKPKRRRNGGK